MKRHYTLDLDSKTIVSVDVDSWTPVKLNRGWLRNLIRCAMALYL